MRTDLRDDKPAGEVRREVPRRQTSSPSALPWFLESVSQSFDLLEFVQAVLILTRFHIGECPLCEPLRLLLFRRIGHGLDLDLGFIESILAFAS